MEPTEQPSIVKELARGCVSFVSWSLVFIVYLIVAGFIFFVLDTGLTALTDAGF